MKREVYKLDAFKFRYCFKFSVTHEPILGHTQPMAFISKKHFRIVSFSRCQAFCGISVDGSFKALYLPKIWYKWQHCK